MAVEHTLSPDLLRLLVCPLTKGPLEYSEAAGELISIQAGLAYPVRRGVPVMVAEQARSLNDAEARSLNDAEGDASVSSRHIGC